MKIRFLTLYLLSFMLLSCGPEDGTYSFTICTTNDVHGRYFDSLYVGGATSGSLLSVSRTVDSLRQAVNPRDLILVDVGDCVQGDNASYYYNYVDTLSVHLYARMANRMGYDAVVVGNHDIEAGHPVYDRLRKELRCPLLAANAVRTSDGKPYFQDYFVTTRNGFRIAVIGFTNPNIRNWLSPELWSGMEFETLIPYAQEYVDKVRRREHPDIVIVAAHVGTGPGLTSDGDDVSDAGIESQGKALLQTLEGVDFVLCAHDHQPAVIQTDSICLINSGSHCRYLGCGRIDLTVRDGRIVSRKHSASLIPLRKDLVDTAMRSAFRQDYEAVKEFTMMPVGQLAIPLVTRDSYTGMCAYTDLIHSVSLGCPPAEISFAAPLTYDGVVEAGTIIYNDLFKIYPFENQLFVVRMTGREIRDYLEYSYGTWINTVSGCGGEHLLKIEGRPDPVTGITKWSFSGRAYNFDSAAGLEYEVDIRRPRGERVRIESLASGEPFCLDSTYNVAMTSYRASGGGGIMSEGVGIDTGRIGDRVVARYPEIRDLIYDAIKKSGTLSAENISDRSRLGSWSFVPRDMASEILVKDMELLFGD